MIYMLGGAGYHNFGDELMVRCWLDFFRRYCPGRQVVVEGASRRSLIEAFEADYPEVRFTDVVSTIAEMTDSRKFWPSFIRGVTFFQRGGFDAHPKHRAEAQAMLDASILHLHGGGYLNDHFPRKAFLMGVAIAVSRLTGARLVGTGLGLIPIVQPTDEERAAIAGTLEQFTDLETRDRQGAEMLKALAPEANIVSGVDDTFIGPLHYAPPSGGGRRLHLSWNEAELDLPVFKRVEDYAIKHAASYDEVLFWACARNDAGSWRRLETTVPGIRRVDFKDLVLSPLPVARGDHMLTARFHPHVIGARGGAVGGYYSGGTYYDVKHGSICDIGSGFFPIKDTPIEPRQFGRRKNTLVDRTPDLRASKLGRAIMFFCEDADAG